MKDVVKDIRTYIYFFIASGGVLISDTEGFTNFADQTPLQWARIALAAALSGFTAVKAFMSAPPEPSTPPKP